MAVGLSRAPRDQPGLLPRRHARDRRRPDCRILLPRLFDTTRRIRKFLSATPNIPRALRHIDLRCGSDPARQHLILVFRATKRPRFPLEALVPRLPRRRRHLGQPEPRQGTAGPPRPDRSRCGASARSGSTTPASVCASRRGRSSRSTSRSSPRSTSGCRVSCKAASCWPTCTRESERTAWRSAPDSSACCSPRARAAPSPTSSPPCARAGSRAPRSWRDRSSARWRSCASGPRTPSCSTPPGPAPRSPSSRRWPTRPPRVWPTCPASPRRCAATWTRSPGRASRPGRCNRST